MTSPRTPVLRTLALAFGLLAAPLAAEEGPIRLFPPVDEPEPPSVQEPEVRVEGLEQPTADAIGLPAPEGLGGDPWRDSDPRLVRALLEDLPVRTANPGLRALARRLLVTPAPRPPAGEEGRLLAARIEWLLVMGELDGARALVRGLPPGYGGEAVERPAAETLLLAGETAAACERSEGTVHRSQAPFWSKLAALCRLHAGETAEAHLAVELLREAAAGGGEADDPVFFALFDAAAAGGSAEIALPEGTGPSPLHLALLREAGAPVPGGPVDELPPGHLRAIAHDPASPAGLRVAAAERAAALGALPWSELAAVYASAAAGEPPDEEGLSPAGLRLLAATPEGRARLYRDLGAEGSATLWAEAVDALWRAERDPHLRVVLTGLFALPLAELAPDPGETVTAAAALGLLAAGRPDAAREWRALAGDAEPVPIAFALALDEEPDAAALDAMLAELPAPDGRRLLALFHGLGTPAPPALGRLTAAPEGGAEAPRLALRRAADAGRTGETALLALHLLDARPEQADPAALAESLEGLRQVGLDAEARAVAVATLLAMAEPGSQAEGRGDG